MNTELPLYGQGKPNTCALACLRMVLAAFGTQVREATLEAQAQLEERGTGIDELERLARQFHLFAEIKETTVEQLGEILAARKLPIAYIDRAIFQLSPAQRARHPLRNAKIHTVIPTRVGRNSVTFLDPLGPAITRRTIRLFRRMSVLEDTA
jgi:ABC-type bacteriocin/lantibiotic exporter with double-glycine peptidase domain